jgi:hypothetical protein
MHLRLSAPGFDQGKCVVRFFRRARLESISKFRRAFENGGYVMRNQDIVSDGYLALTAAGFVLLCSSLLAFAFN